MHRNGTEWNGNRKSLLCGPLNRGTVHARRCAPELRQETGNSEKTFGSRTHYRSVISVDPYLDQWGLKAGGGLVEWTAESGRRWVLAGQTLDSWGW